MALRIVLQCVESHANRYGRYIVPLLSLSIDFYVRLFVRVYTGQKQCKKTTSKLGYVYQCNGCETINTQPLGLLIQDDKSNNVKVYKSRINCLSRFKKSFTPWIKYKINLKYPTFINLFSDVKLL